MAVDRYAHDASATAPDPAMARLVAMSLPRSFVSPSETSSQVPDGGYRTDNEDPQADHPSANVGSLVWIGGDLENEPPQEGGNDGDGTRHERKPPPRCSLRGLTGSVAHAHSETTTGRSTPTVGRCLVDVRGSFGAPSGTCRRRSRRAFCSPRQLDREDSEHGANTTGAMYGSPAAETVAGKRPDAVRSAECRRGGHGVLPCAALPR